MNKTEVAFAQHLDLLQRVGTIKRWWFEAIRIRVGHDCWWNPDFLVENPDGTLVLYDTKGTRVRGGRRKMHAEDDALVKGRAIADKFPIPVYFTWKEKNGEWSSKRL